MKHTLNVDESLDGLQENANSECEEKHAVEEGTKKLGSLPSKRQILRGFGPF